jgi:competence protein ComEA
MNGSDATQAFERLRAVFRRQEGFADEPPGSPEVGFSSRFDPGLPGVRVLVLAGVLAALLAGLYLWWSRPKPEAAPRAVLSPAVVPAYPVAAKGPSPSPSSVVVDVAGKVRHPGVVGLPAGARVIDAIKAAGGLRRGASAGTLNLARRVVDGEQIAVGIDLTPSPGAVPSGAATGEPIDLNTASAAQLDQLPGVGPVLAQRIVDYRTRRGAFRSIDELRQVSGIGEAKFADIKGLVRV